MEVFLFLCYDQTVEQQSPQREILVKRKVNGVDIIELAPTPKMRAFAIAWLADPTNHDKDPEEVLKSLGFSQKLFREWLQFDPYFSEWLDDVRLMFTPKSVGKMLEMVGMEKALKGDFSFWKPFALKHKVIDPDNASLTIIPANLGAFNEWDEQRVLDHKNSLLDALRGVQEQGGIDVASADLGGKSEGDPHRTITLPKESVAVSDALGTDREREL